MTFEVDEWLPMRSDELVQISGSSPPLQASYNPKVQISDMLGNSMLGTSQYIRTVLCTVYFYSSPLLLMYVDWEGSLSKTE